MATFITSKSVGQTMNINVQTSTGFWKYNHDGSDSSMFGNGNQTITVANVNGEFTIISCLSDGTVSGDITQLNLGNNLLTSFDGTSLTSLTNLNLYNNQLTSLVGFIFPTSLTTLQLGNNQLTSFDATGLPNLVGLVLTSNPLTPSVNNQILNQLNQNGLSGGYFESNNGRSSASITDYNNLVSLGWEFSGLQIIDTTTPPTFITSKAVGDSISINVTTSTGYWKYNHNGSDSSVNANGWVNDISVTNINGEFTIISCDSDGTVSGNITYLNLPNNQLTSFDGTGLSSLNVLGLSDNQLTSFDGTGLSGLTGLDLNNNQLTSFDGTGLSGLTGLGLGENQLTSFDGTGLSGLIDLNLSNNQLTSLDGFIFPTSLTSMGLSNNQLTSFDGTGLSSLNGLYLNGNPMTTSSNNQILQQLSQNEISVGDKGAEFYSSNGRTSASNVDYDNLVSLGWTLEGLDVVIPTTFITSKAVGETININVHTSTGYWKYNHDGSDSSVIYASMGIFGNGWGNNLPVTNVNGEFTIISCDSNGTVSGDITRLRLENIQLTSFDGTGLSSLIELRLQDNQLTSFDGTDLSSLPGLNLGNNQLTSLDGFIFPTSLTDLGLPNNLLTSFDGTGLSGLTSMVLSNNQLTSFDGTNLSSLIYLELSENPLTPSVNNQILQQLNQNGLSGGEFYSSNGRTSASNADYDNLVSLGWTFEGLDLIIPPTFITSKAVGETINIYAETSTGFWKYNHDGSDSSVFGSGNQTISVTNANGEFTLIPCDGSGNVSGDITYLDLYNNQLTSFDGTGLSSLILLNFQSNQLTSFDGTDLTSLIRLYLSNNQLTSIDVTGLSSLTELYLQNNQLTSFDGTGLSSLTGLYLDTNQLTSFDGTGLSSLTGLDLPNNQLTSFDGTDLTNLMSLTLNNNQLTSINLTGCINLHMLNVSDNPSIYQPSINNNVISLYAANTRLHGWGENGMPFGGSLTTSGGRWPSSNVDYNYLVTAGGINGSIELVPGPTFITSKAVGETINIYAETSTGFWKYNHDGSDSSVLNQGSQSPTITNVNGEFTLISCDESGNVSGDVTYLNLNLNQLTSFDGTGLSSLTGLYLGNNQLTSFNGSGLSSLTDLSLDNNQLTSFDGTGLTSLTFLDLSSNQLTLFDGTGLSSLTQLFLNGHRGGDGTLTSVSNLPTSLTNLELVNNQLTSFDGTGLTSLTELYLDNNQLTSFDGTGLSSLTDLILNNNQLTSFDGTGLTSLTFLDLYSNQLTSLVNNQILQQLNQNGLSGGYFSSNNGRTSTSNADYDNLVSLGWNFDGLDLPTPPVVGNGKLRVKGFRPTQPQPWDGGTIYNIGAVVTLDGQTWNCIQYAPAGYGPFGGYIDVYWTL